MSPADVVTVPDARIIELAERLIAPGPKASHVSASECHEISDYILNLAAAPTSEPGEAVAWRLNWPNRRDASRTMTCFCESLGDAEEEANFIREGGREATITPLYAAPPSMAALLAELRGLQRYRIAADRALMPDADGGVVIFADIKDILSRYPESK